MNQYCKKIKQHMKMVISSIYQGIFFAINGNIYHTHS